MFAQLSSFVALGLAVVNAAPVSITSSSVAKPAPTGWATGYLESYKEYNIRYKALDCSTQHNTTFFEDCCHPLLANETLTIRPSVCTPGQSANATASAIYATETSNSTEIYTEYCEEATSVASDVASVIATATESINQVTLTSNSSTATLVVQIAPSSTAEAVISSYVPEATSSSEWTAPSSSTEEAVESTSVYVAAAAVSTTPAYVAPTTTSTYQAPAATTPAASSGGDAHTGGHATYYYQGGNAGACGWYKSDSDKIIAINGNGFWQNTGSASSYCGKWITITNTNNGRTTTAMVADVCPSCTDSNNSLDLSVGAFQDIASLDDGQVPITWTFN
ncbi:hypothetical protein QFC21_000593 [Naganishia friedmannii]|uniref:Uncharacterized protein n=1 Tax=Naganishia friedmannii TaxID=89922 RepID=A0ACC2WDH1_9TREE|nr:hypothetical protein QFC21_000593 [Naganishia friedmannii]